MAAPTPKAAIIHDRCRVAPPPAADATAELYLPLTFLDMGWLHFHPIQRLIFYHFPCSKLHFLETVVPSLKQSLSRTLNLYLPLAGNLLYPVDSGMPVFRYVSGDSVSVTIAEANEASDLIHLTGKGFKDADEFYPFVPDFPEILTDAESDFRIIPLLAIQVTLFPDSGVCIGISNHHAIGDASSIIGFIKSWSSVSKHGEESQSISSPFYDRSVIKDPSGLAATYWNQSKLHTLKSLPPIFPTNKVRATYILQKNDIQKLRSAAMTKDPSLLHLSSFTLTTAFVWSCLVKSTGEEIDPDEPEHFAFAADARSRINPAVPANYFGNCLAFVKTKATHGELKGDDGFVVAVRLIGDVINSKVNDRDEIFKDAENWLQEFGALIGKRTSGVAGSPRFDVYDTDFGWGKPIKYEAVSIDGDGSMALCKSVEFEGGLEIGLSLPAKNMKAFDEIFHGGLTFMTS